MIDRSRTRSRFYPVLSRFSSHFPLILILHGVQPARLESSTKNEIFKIWSKSGELHFDCLLMQFPWHGPCSRENFMTLFVLLDCALYGKIDLLRKIRKFSEILAELQAKIMALVVAHKLHKVPLYFRESFYGFSVFITMTLERYLYIMFPSKYPTWHSKPTRKRKLPEISCSPSRTSKSPLASVQLCWAEWQGCAAGSADIFAVHPVILCSL